MYNRFNEDKAFLKNQYKKQNWIENSGVSPEELRDNCNKIADMPGVSRMIKKAKLVEYVLDNAQIFVNPHDWFQLQINHCSVITDIRQKWIEEIEESEMKEIEEKNRLISEYRAIAAICDFGHVAPDWEAITELGITGIIKRLQKASENKEISKEQKEFFEAGLTAYNALKRYIIRLSEAAAVLGMNNKRMTAVAQNLKNLSVAAPSNLSEAMQLSLIMYYVMTWVEGDSIRSLGRIDMLWANLYENDLKSGKFTESELREFIDYFYYELYAMGAVANSPFCLCGQNDDGSAYINRLTYVLTEEYIKCNINDPKIHIRYSGDLPEDFVDMVLKAIINGTNSIVFLNDDVAIKSLVKNGIDKNDAINYAPIGCYEPAACGKEIPCSSAGRINLLKAVEYAMSNGVDTITGTRVYPAEKTPESFDEFICLIKKYIKRFADSIIGLINEYEKNFMQMNPSPILSGTIAECAENGKDVYAGGAKYNNTSVYVFGIADLVDSITAVKNLVYENKVLEYKTFCDILQNNWNGTGLLNLKCRNLLPKYGNNEDESDKIMTEFVKYIADNINKRKNARGGVYRCGLFSIDMYQSFGERTGATPNGRKHGEWFSKNLSPTIGNDKKGVTALINSVTKVDYTDFPNGAVLDLTLHSSAVKGREGLAAMKGILNTFVKRGGMSLQFNVLNPDTLKEAQKNPELYPNLQVRLCGWNVYFANLSREEQNEFIQMAEHSGE